ncbi:hypothetical protein BT96DRAFT_999239 [Gymnopus androsaceus JB14]|uniref:Uncharacterized protein n=1 Tax=Gymnopus androsaceus JB14 TaxID=1447944 RepID=A0A6A4H8X6_9AGAR|nr:hypothetical protein BT96DRAFT_999239 [Gymnopus androsaceus JB14]
MPSEGSSTSHHEGAGSHQEQAEHAHEQRLPNHALQVNPNDLNHVKMAKMALNKLPNELVEKISTQHNLDLHASKMASTFQAIKDPLRFGIPHAPNDPHHNMNNILPNHDVFFKVDHNRNL